MVYRQIRVFEQKERSVTSVDSLQLSFLHPLFRRPYSARVTWRPGWHCAWETGIIVVHNTVELSRHINTEFNILMSPALSQRSPKSFSVSQQPKHLLHTQILPSGVAPAASCNLKIGESKNRVLITVLLVCFSCKPLAGAFNFQVRIRPITVCKISASKVDNLFGFCNIIVDFMLLLLPMPLL